VKKDGSIAVLGLEIFFPFFLFLFFGGFFVADHKSNTFFFFTFLSLSLMLSCLAVGASAYVLFLLLYTTTTTTLHR
jgi:hypothetical protein